MSKINCSNSQKSIILFKVTVRFIWSPAAVTSGGEVTAREGGWMLPVKHLDELQLLCVKSDLNSTAVYTNCRSLLTVFCFSSWSVKAASHLDLCFYERATYCCFNPLRYDQRRDSSQHYLNDGEENPSRDNEEVSSYYLGTLESSKNSGLSSSSFELSQYINGAEHSDAAGERAGEASSSLRSVVITLTHVLFLSERGPVHPTSAPLKYSIPHAIVSFGPAGQLIRVNPGRSTQENVNQLEIHSLEVD